MRPNSVNVKARWAVLGLALILTSCGGSGGAGSKGGTSSAGDTVTIKLIAFKPEQLTVKAGTTVTWKNDDAVDHTVTSGTVDQQGGTVKASADGTFDSGVLAGGKSFTFTFRSPGTFAFFCNIHPATMRGSITVN